jgi:hypothetical protein
LLLVSPRRVVLQVSGELFSLLCEVFG